MIPFLNRLIGRNLSSNDWKMNDYHAAWIGSLSDEVAKHDLSEDQVDEVLKASFEESSEIIAAELSAELLKRRPSMLRARDRAHRGFVKRNKLRWKRGFDDLQQLIRMSEELGSSVIADIGTDAASKNDPIFEAIISNHARSILVAKEAFTLMENGFPDGAMGRWRTLHEIAVIMQFLSASEPEYAERYLVSRHVQAWRYARTYMKHHERANLGPFSANDLEALKRNAELVCEKYGAEIKSDYGWVWPKIGAKWPTFSQIEEFTGLDHWRPRYQWATVSTHGPYRAPIEGLGMVESLEAVRLVGPSNSGMVDPAHMVAITLNLSNASLVAMSPNLDRLSLLKIMIRISDQLGEQMMEDERISYERAAMRDKV